MSVDVYLRALAFGCRRKVGKNEPVLKRSVDFNVVGS